MFLFFFSSRRRHTRLQGDWSSDVCSSDLVKNTVDLQVAVHEQDALSTAVGVDAQVTVDIDDREIAVTAGHRARTPRSEERRVGKESGSRWGARELTREDGRARKVKDEREA